MGAPDKIKTLVESFHRNIDDYKTGKKNETELRREYLDPFFTELGWDVVNDKTYADAYKDVVHEYPIKTKKGNEFPDYCFRIGQTPKFFVEAKQPSVNVKDDVKPALQVRGYGWSAKLPLSILTDFEEFAVYDCRIPPNKNDKASVARITLITYDQYIDKWDEIESIFARESILKGSFDKYVESNKKKKGTAEVDEVFLTQMEEWRKSLAKNIALRNPYLSIRELNYAVQKTIDRIIFLRICEDRGIEEYGQLLSLQKSSSVYAGLKQIFHRADEKYNSGLFHFEKEKDRTEEPDSITLNLTVDDKTLKEIIKELYYPESSFKFSVIPADILGQVYEQFLGKVIRLTPSHQAIIDDKPEVKKAGGVYYTPTYIVDYIVNNTVGRLLTSSHLPKGRNEEGFSSPKEVSNLKILDPACGSGSFLLGAYQYLLDWHLKYYTNELKTNDKLLKQKQPPVYINEKGNYLLTTSEKKRILLNNIYGVDIDSQAVEVTKLSLMLKVLEGESTQTLNNELKFFRERALPDLSNNIKCGNSLIGPDFYNQTEMNFLDDEEKLRINVFDWHKEFPQVFNTTSPSIPLLTKEREEKGEVGFDVVIGNPPYLYSAGQEYAEYFSNHYKLQQYQADFYSYFIERILSLCKRGSYFSFIVPDSWMNSQYLDKIRSSLFLDHGIIKIVIFNYLVFKNVSLENSIFVIKIGVKSSNIEIEKFQKPKESFAFNKLSVDDCIRTGIINPSSSQSAIGIINKIEKLALPIEKMFLVNRGIHAYRTDGYGKSKFGSGYQSVRDKEEQSYHSPKKLDESYLPELKGKHIFRYRAEMTGVYLSYGGWLAEPRTPEYFFKPKIAIRKILGNKLSGTYLEEPFALDQSLYIIIHKHNDVSMLKSLLGILLSSVGAWYIRNKYSIFDTLYPWYTVKQLKQFPIKADSLVLADKVDSILNNYTKLSSVKTPTERTAIERQIAVTEAQIDQLVYQLYGLTEEEIKIVEQS